MRSSVVGTAIFLACSGSDSSPGDDLPASWTLTNATLTVEIAKAPYGYVVKDPSGNVVLQTRNASEGEGFDAIATATGEWSISRTVTPGYFETNSDLRWQEGYRAIAASQPGPETLELTIASSTPMAPTVRVVHRLRPSTMRVEANVVRTGMEAAPRAWAAGFVAPAAEGFLGLGERFTRTNFRGASVYSWAEEGGVGKEEGAAPSPLDPAPNGPSMSYYPVPFFLSTKGYGFWLDSTWWNRYDLATPPHEDAWRVWHVGPTLAYEVYVPIPGDARPWPYHVIDRFTEATGRPMTPPTWAYGPRRRIGFGLQPNGKSEIENMREGDLALTTGDDTNHFLPDGHATAVIAGLKENIEGARAFGVRMTAYFNPFFNRDPAAPIAPKVREAIAKHYFLETHERVPSEAWILTGGSIVNLHMIDFTNAAASAFYTSLFEPALAYGYSGWMYDFGEYVQADAVASNGMTAPELHNLYPVLYQKAAHDFLEAGPHRGDWLLYARSGYTGASQYMPQVWSGDPAADFASADGLPSMPRAAINIGIAGVPNWGGDIGGFHCLASGARAADGELVTRWIQQGATLPDMHDEDACVGGNGSKATIWTSPEAQSAWKTYARLHTRLMPYFHALGVQAHATGAPITRHVFLENPDRPDLASVDDAYYVGPSLLAAPVVARGAVTKTIDLPAGNWLDWTASTPALVVGGAPVTLAAPLAKLPLLLRDGALVPMLDATIDTLAARTPATRPEVVTPEDVASVYDVVAFLTTSTNRKSASFSLADGSQLAVAWTAGASSLPIVMTEAELSTCAAPGCALATADVPGGTLKRVRASTTAGASSAEAGGVAFSPGAVARRVRWDVYVAP